MLQLTSVLLVVKSGSFPNVSKTIKNHSKEDDLHKSRFCLWLNALLLSGINGRLPKAVKYDT